MNLVNQSCSMSTKLWSNVKEVLYSEREKESLIYRAYWRDTTHLVFRICINCWIVYGTCAVNYYHNYMWGHPIYLWLNRLLHIIIIISYLQCSYHLHSCHSCQISPHSSCEKELTSVLMPSLVLWERVDISIKAFTHLARKSWHQY